MAKICYRFSIIILLLAASPSGYSQVSVTSNDGFEGTPAEHIPPTGWTNCNDGCSTADTQPGIWHVKNTLASEGQTFVDLCTRKSCQPGTVETIWADLINTFEKNHCYNLKIDLSLSDEARAPCGFNTLHMDKPCVLEIYGFNGDCYPSPSRELLWKSQAVTHFEWQTYSVYIKPMTGSFEKIALRSNFTPDSNIQNTFVFIDNLRFADVPGSDFLHGGLLHLPAYATGINWYFNGTAVQGENNSVMPFLGSGNYSAAFFDQNNCFITTSVMYFDLNDMFSVIPNLTFDNVTLNCLSAEKKDVPVNLYDATGRLVYKQLLNLSPGKNEFPVSLSDFAPGCYYFVFNSNSKMQTVKCLLLNTY